MLRSWTMPPQTNQPPRVGELYRCHGCRKLHVVEQPYADRTTAERWYLYVTCGAGRYFVGQVLSEKKS